MKLKKLFTLGLAVASMVFLTQSSFASETTKDDNVKSKKADDNKVICTCDDDTNELTILKNGIVIKKEAKEYQILVKECEKEIEAAKKAFDWTKNEKR